MKLFRVFYFLSFLTILCAAPGMATMVGVPGDYGTIQGAIDACMEGDSILVEAGVYPELIDFTGKDVVVISQYAFTEDSTDIVNTVIDANFLGTAVTFVSGETCAAVLKGFTITNGMGSEYVTPYGTFNVGGGVYIIESSPTLQYNLITNNESVDGGAGLFCDGGDPFIDHCYFIANFCIAEGCGAGMLIKNSTDATISWNYVQDNQARHAGGIAIKNSHPLVTRNVITGNSAETQAGGMWIYDCSNPDVINNTISDNSAPAGTGGGVLVTDATSPNFMNNIVSFSVCGGGIVSIGCASPVLSFNLFYDNTGGDYIGCVPGVGDETGDPAYVGGMPFDYHLTGTSAAIDMGNPDPSYDDPDGTQNDVGAFYYDQGTTEPVTLSCFSGNVTQDGVVLVWETASEINCYGWYVQRSSDGVDYQNVSDLIAGHNTSTVMQHYTFTDGSVAQGESYTYRLKQIDLSGATTLSNPISVMVGHAVATNLGLAQNYPNPFNPETSIAYTLPEASHVQLTIYDINGRLVAELVNNLVDAGYHAVTWNAESLPSGTYIYRLVANDQTFTKTLTLLK